MKPSTPERVQAAAARRPSLLRWTLRVIMLAGAAVVASLALDHAAHADTPGKSRLLGNPLAPLTTGIDSVVRPPLDPGTLPGAVRIQPAQTGPKAPAARPRRLPATALVNPARPQVRPGARPGQAAAPALPTISPAKAVPPEQAVAPPKPPAEPPAQPPGLAGSLGGVVTSALHLADPATVAGVVEHPARLVDAALGPRGLVPAVGGVVPDVLAPLPLPKAPPLPPPLTPPPALAPPPPGDLAGAAPVPPAPAARVTAPRRAPALGPPPRPATPAHASPAELAPVHAPSVRARRAAASPAAPGPERDGPHDLPRVPEQAGPTQARPGTGDSADHHATPPPARASEAHIARRGLPGVRPGAGGTPDAPHRPG